MATYTFCIRCFMRQRISCYPSCGFSMFRSSFEEEPSYHNRLRNSSVAVSKPQQHNDAPHMFGSQYLVLSSLSLSNRRVAVALSIQRTVCNKVDGRVFERATEDARRCTYRTKASSIWYPFPDVAKIPAYYQSFRDEEKL